MKRSLQSFYPNENYNIENTYIITLPNNETSKKLTQRCIQSCESVGQPYTLWEGFDGSSGEIVIPEHLKNKEYLKWIKVNHKFMTPSQIGCCLSHISLWFHCITIDRPIVILEHDAIMVSKFDGMYPFYNAITYLGCRDKKTEIVLFNQLQFICKHPILLFAKYIVLMHMLLIPLSQNQ